MFYVRPDGDVGGLKKRFPWIFFRTLLGLCKVSTICILIGMSKYSLILRNQKLLHRRDAILVKVMIRHFLWQASVFYVGHPV